MRKRPERIVGDVARRLGLLGLIATVLVALLGVLAPAASASPTFHPQTRVAAIEQPTGQVVGPHDSVLADQGRPRAPNYDQSATGSSVAAEGGADDSHLYRGVATDHPGYQDALNGNSIPRGGDASALEHNLGDTNSPFTSWTTDAEVAKEFAGSDGVILRIANAQGPGYNLVTSPYLFGESQVLVEGNVIDAQRFFASWEGLGR
jgi:hypothetical protein